MKQIRTYGNKPYNIVLLHGGPGAAGELAPVAEELAQEFGVLEPMQTESDIKGQIDELKSNIDKHSSKPITLIGWSWGAWLAYLFTAYHPEYVKKLILLSSGPFEKKYGEEIMKTRLRRLKEDDQVMLLTLFETFDKSDTYLQEIIRLIDKADAYQHMPHEDTDINFNYNIYKSIWAEAEELRGSGNLLSYGEHISCPVFAIHGNHDPHPYEGVIMPLSKILKNFKYEIIDKCGHHPWFEEYAKEKFYNLLKQELR